MRRSTACLLLLPALLLTACGDDTDVETGSDPTPTDEGSDPAPPNGDDTEVAISIEVGGGFVPYGYDFAAVPTVVHEDGTAFTSGVVTAIYPGPALMPVLTGDLPAEDLGGLLDRAEEIGLASEEELDAGTVNVTDTPTTMIEVTIDGETYVHEIYALGIEAGGIGGGGSGLTDEQRRVRDEVAAFVADVNDTVAAVATEVYEAEAYDLLPQPLADAGTVEDVQPNQLDWPFPYPIVEDRSCMHLDGEDAATFTELLAQATQITEWTDPSNGATYRITARAVIPGFDRDC